MTFTSSNSSLTHLFTDSNTVEAFGRAGSCHATVTLLTGYVAKVHGLRIFFKDSTSGAPSYVVNLKISGKTAASSEETLLHTFDSSAHSGWN
jgi:hypothetical protein